jgi:hypothetical protein
MHKEITQQLPKSLKLLLCYRKTPTLVAFAILIIGGIFSIVQLSDFDFREFFKLKEEKAVTDGIITNSYYTGIKESIGEDEGYYFVNAYVYEYKVNKEDHKWVSYSRNSIKKVGEKVVVVYSVTSPQYSVIKGFRYRANGTSVLFLLVLPITSLLVLLLHVYKGLKYLKIINNGIITKGKLSKKKEIYDGDIITYYKLIFTYYTNDKNRKRYQTTVKTSHTKPFQDEGKEVIIYNKNNPNQSFLLDDLANPISKYIKNNWIK